MKLDAFDKRVAFESLRREFDPDGPLFIDYAEHLAAYEGSPTGPRWCPTVEPCGRGQDVADVTALG